MLAAGSWFLLITASWLRWNMMTPAPGGRLLFPALPAVALLLARGWTGWGRRLVVPGSVLLLAGLAWWTVAAILPGFFLPPRHYSERAALAPAQEREATLGEEIRLLGYEAHLNERAGHLDVTLYWEVLERPAEDYLLTLQLVSAQPGDTTLRWNYNSWPGRGNYPTAAWQPGTFIKDGYRFDLPPADFPTQAWDLHLALYRQEDEERLPITLDGAPAGDYLTLTRFRLSGQQPDCPAIAQLEGEIGLGEAVQLTHAALTPTEDETTVTLCWQAEAPLFTDYTVFVHLLDAAGELIATGDGPPAAGAFPTSFWQPGDLIRDVHRLPTVEEGSRVVVGLYDPLTGARLPAQRNGVPLPADAITIWP